MLVNARSMVISLALVPMLAMPSRAHPGHDHGHGHGGSFVMPSRTWSLGEDGSTLQAAFVVLRDNKVHLRDRRNKAIVLELRKLSAADQAWVLARTDAIRHLNRAGSAANLLVREPLAAAPKPDAAQAFEPFNKQVGVTWDDRFLYVESNGLPDHPMMKGIRSWQQQVPLPQSYTGDNAWRIPLHPELAARPISARNALVRGAIALAVNGVPIFNALNNRGEDAFLAGELDEWGGHCGRADDYHYHIAPLHLQKIVGKDSPIAYALDGFPIYGLTEPDGSPVGKLDEFNGKFDKAGNYRYQATVTYPYINGGLRGRVEIRGDQIEPQPRSFPIRPAFQPLRGATITDFKSVGESGYRLVYERQGLEHIVEYTLNKDGTCTFVFQDDRGNRRTETYRRPRDRGPGRGDERR